ncbi:MAG: hypothetical protein KatS3mg015_0736 [Fimbriimonadales bacterium]|nr:MAG: hypothetical protein KatS3mg015_0736 [Fimbriimonadales bacterium]
MFQVGDTLYLVVTTDRGSTAHAVKVEQVEPLVVLGAADELASIRTGDRVNLVYKNGGDSQHSEAIISEIGRYGLSLVLHLDGLSWKAVDRRRAPRYSVSMPARLTMVADGAGEPIFEAFDCETLDVSMVGCKVRTEAPVIPGTLMAVSLFPPDGEEFRFTGIVTRADDEFLGIEFFDYSGTTRFRFAQYLNDLAGEAA